MNAITIQITPDEFGIVAREAISHGFDVTTYLINSAVNRKALPAPAPVQEVRPEPAAAPKLPPAPSSGILKGLPAA